MKCLRVGLVAWMSIVAVVSLLMVDNVLIQDVWRRIPVIAPIRDWLWDVMGGNL